jgi:ABC-type lipoprotein export system ATPase subunit
MNVLERAANNAGPVIRLTNLQKSYRTAAGDVPVLHDINLEIRPGEFVGVIGKSGSGKSTLLNMIAGIDRPTSGEVWVGGSALHRLGEGQLAAWRGRQLGIIFQFFQLLPMLSLAENIMLPMDFAGLYSLRQRSERAGQLLDLVGLADQAHKLPSALSGGQQQRAAIARALANDPPLLVADEPTGNLDSRTAESVFELFAGLVRQGKTVVMVTHDNGLARRVGRTVILADGGMVDENVARALPTLTADQMIYATRRLTVRNYEPGAVIFAEGRPGDCFYIVVDGKVNILTNGPRNGRARLTELGSGQYFGEIEMLNGGGWAATARAWAGGPVALAEIDRDTFSDLLAQSEATRLAVERTAVERLAEDRAAREGWQ